MRRLKMVFIAALLVLGGAVATVATVSASGQGDSGRHTPTPAPPMATPTPTPRMATPTPTQAPRMATPTPAMNNNNTNTTMPGMPATGAPPGA